MTVNVLVSEDEAVADPYKTPTPISNDLKESAIVLSEVMVLAAIFVAVGIASRPDEWKILISIEMIVLIIGFFAWLFASWGA